MVDKNTLIHIKVSEDDREILEASANKFGLTLSSYCRMILKEFINKNGEIKLTSTNDNLPKDIKY